ncbi:MAG TPA: hypothetical protein VFS40_12635 [Gemmatimonadales bacterium]|nr:hypothetical protein [Gemmatimonadales bacterium]
MSPKVREVGPSTQGGDLETRPRFTVDVEVSGHFVPGGQLQVRPRMTGLVATADVELRVTLPELEVAARPDGFHGVIPTGTPLPVRGHRRAPLSAGASVDAPFALRVPQPGYYRIVVQAVKRSAEPEREGGIWYESGASIEKWVLVDTAGGRLTDRFDASLLPSGAAPMAGPFRSKRSGALLTAGGGTEVVPLQKCQEDCIPTTTVCVNWHAVYYNEDVGGYQPLSFAAVEGSRYHSDGSFFGAISGQTDANGVVVLCATGYDYYRANIVLKNADVIQGSIAASLEGNAYWGPDETVTAVDHYTPRAFVVLTNTAQKSRSMLGYGRPQTRFILSSADSNSYYSPSDDRIVLRTSHVYYPGVFTMAHEYGHALQEKGLGGNPYPDYGGACGKPHFMDGAYTLGCALSEGFANFHAAYVQGDILTYGFGSDYDMEDNRDYPGYYYNGYTTLGVATDGSLIEGAVAAFLYDLVDGPSSPNSATNGPRGVDDDGVTLPGSYIATILSTCQTRSSGWLGYHRANGIDDIIYCMENQIDPAVTGSSVYFPTRGSDPNAFTEGAAEPAGWSAAAVRRLWTHNLYGASW